VCTQNLEYKFIELLSATFLKSADEVIQQHITYRYVTAGRRRMEEASD
jgi:hypothetical protein